MKKLSAYQKLKIKNSELIKDIYLLCGEGSFINQCEASLRWKLKIESEKMVWNGKVVVGKKDTGKFKDK